MEEQSLIGTPAEGGHRGIKMVIRPLSPALCEDWLEYFDHLAFADHKDWALCYCLEGHLDQKTQDCLTDPQERRQKAVELIQAGSMQGYLAYLEDKVVGWCNVNDRENYLYLTEMFRNIGYQPEEPKAGKVKSIFCFLIAPQYRGQGIAQRLLDRVCQDAARDGYAWLEAYPFADKSFEFKYQRCGFAEAADLKYVKVMRKEL